METTINLRRLFDFSQLPIIITGVVLAVLTVAILLMFLYSILKNLEMKQKELEPVVEEKVFVKPDMTKLKAEYLALLDGIEAKFNCTRSARPSIRILPSSSANTISRSSTKFRKVTLGIIWQSQGD